MNKAQLTGAVAEELKVSKAEAARAVNAVLGTIIKGFKKGRVALPPLGTFTVKKRKARTGINPLTKEKIKIPARKVVTFKAPKSLKL